jgi:hypothetical protein
MAWEAQLPRPPTERETFDTDERIGMVQAGFEVFWEPESVNIFS